MDLFNFSEVDTYIYQILLIDLVIAVLMISALRFISGVVANVDSAEELASRDNYAFGIAMAAGVISLALMLTGAVSGEPGSTYLKEVVSVLSYGVLGLVLIKVGRIAQDKLLFTGIEIQQEIKNGNLAAALVDAGNTIATGLVLRAVMLWVESDTLNGLFAVLASFVITQFMLAIVSKYRLVVYARRSGESLQEVFKRGKVALAVRYFGHLLGVALAITAASGVIAYDVENLVMALVLWSGVTLLFAVLVSLISIAARSIILMGVNVVEEVNEQNNIGVAAIEASIYISIGLFFTALFA
ncbi:MAG: DUF350 domain-containing protein [bacterium]|nr:DUF350 domain-containing protein [Gammaproteobacteria bacterium]HIL96044.1 DUF350 domain-containing protein [Pseudomonadales bacterium]